MEESFNSIAFHGLMGIVDNLLPMVFMYLVFRLITRSMKKYQQDREQETPGTWEAEPPVDEPAEELGFEVPQMRRAPRIERRSGVYQDGVYHETKPLGESESPEIRQNCSASTKGSSITEGRHSCEASEAPSEYKGERPSHLHEEKPQPADRKGPVLNARDLMAVVVMTEVLGKPKALRRR
ncbi:MAG: hypothetical protein Q4D07_01210 [Selenomonadaceae bacterium]|nr:hypothetical protein [Selenomonadaceae bacterium]